ncbi:hypothetical protein K458DRAFT_491738 [Lentithecium fluviatile CBS 122367]|uniref:Ubiquitin 3 binding protein But2 C-terminal domain-containing protein n=1 Tax=Lentithecium fluviatile CBS 122367 TaxID=1168545 RepID=A0A6G1IHI7_9PLEO|nr:hypothetical protein K458DRAFT_491738 [Lentithecium fluviatile CBS 122367]
MKFSACALLALIGLASTTPVPLSTDVPVPVGWPGYKELVKPKFVSTYDIPSGTLAYSPRITFVYFDQLTTITTFDVPASLSGRKCRLGFWLDSLNYRWNLRPNTVLQLFSSSEVPPQANSDHWNPGNKRDQLYGNLKVQRIGDAYVEDWPRLLENFTCPTPGLHAFELVAKWNGGVTYDTVHSGLYLRPI